MKRNRTYQRLKKLASMRSMLYLVLFLFVAISLFATPPQDDNRRRPNRQAQGEQNAPPVREGMGVGSGLLSFNGELWPLR